MEERFTTRFWKLLARRMVAKDLMGNEGGGYWKMKENILGYAVDALSIDACAESIFVRLCAPPRVDTRCTWLACLNPHSYAEALHDGMFNRALLDADWLVPDGAGVVLASRLLGGGIRERVTGSDVFLALHRRMNAVGDLSVFFLGATEDTLGLIRKRMAQDYPNVRVAGTYSPPFKPSFSDQDVASMVVAINAASPDVLWVGLTSPKQDIWIYQNRDKLNVRFAAAIGAVFDFYTGRVKRAHPIFQKMGLEWFIRSIQEPRRLWRRHYVNAPLFVVHVLKAMVRRKLR